MRLPTASRSARSWETSSTVPLELHQRVLQRLAALEVEVVGRLVEDEDVGAGGDQDRQREPPLLAAGDVGELFLDVVAGEEEAAEQGPRPWTSLRPVSRFAASSTVPPPAAVSACWER